MTELPDQLCAHGISNLRAATQVELDSLPLFLEDVIGVPRSKTREAADSK
jgi:hypothetical protein